MSFSPVVSGRHWLGAVNPCAGYDAKRWLPAVLGYTLDSMDGGAMDVADMNAIFGNAVVGCSDAYLKARLQAISEATSAAGMAGGGCTMPEPAKTMCMLQTVIADEGIDADRVKNAAAKMRRNGWWHSSSWKLYWMFLSGSTWWGYLATAGIATGVGYGSYRLYKKWK